MRPNVHQITFWYSFFSALISSLITSRPANRLTADTLTTHSYFSSLAISTLNFLDRSNFASRTREEKAAFMKGLHGVLGRFSEGLKRRKILPSLLDEVRILGTVSTWPLRQLADERSDPPILYPPERFRYCLHFGCSPILGCGASVPQALVLYKRSAHSHDGASGKPRDPSIQDQQSGLPDW